MKQYCTFLPLCRLWLLMLLLHGLSTIGQAQGTQTIPAGSFIVNMGVVPQTVANGLKPYGLLYDLFKNRNIPVLWTISSSKVKDGPDFTYNSVAYRGGSFIILANYRTAAVNTTISTWQAKGVVGLTTTSDFTAPVFTMLSVPPRWTLDLQNGSIAQAFLAAAEIPSAAYGGTDKSGWKNPADLNGCDDIFVMPHADPTWATHSNLYYWNKTYKGAIWAGCHAVSVLESISGTDARVDPANPGTVYQLNLLSQTGLINYTNHSGGNPPYVLDFPNDPIMQFMGITDAAQQNGSEQIYLPLLGGGWLPTTSYVGVYNTTQKDLLLGSTPGKAAAIVYGRAYGDDSRGLVLYEAAHNIGGTGVANIAAQRAFFNFSFLAATDKAIMPALTGIAGSGTGSVTITSGQVIPLTAGLPAGTNPTDYTFAWSTSCGGTFAPNATSQSTTFTAPTVASTLNCLVTIVITDKCGRTFSDSKPVTIISTPPKQPVSGFVFKDADGNGTKASGEGGVGLPLFVKLLPRTGTTCGTTALSAVAADPTTGAYSFSAVDAGDYCLVVDNNNTLGDVTPTLPGGYSATSPTTISPLTVATAPVTNQNFGLLASPPIAGNDAVNTLQNTPVTASVTNNDSDPNNNLDPNSYFKLTNPTNGMVVFNSDGSYTYTPNNGYTGSDSFTYRVCDLTLPAPLCATATVTITITSTPTQPVSGHVFNDINGDGFRGSGDGGTGVAFYVKLIPRTGSVCGATATAATAADPVTGAYNFAGVTAGDYCLVVDDNATLTDVTPTVPTTLANTTPTTISTLTVANTPVFDRNFGLQQKCLANAGTPSK